MSDYLERMNQVLRPIAPPRVIEGVYTDDQHRRMFDVVKQHGPWPTITPRTTSTPWRGSSPPSPAFPRATT
ncbi:MAG: hypothetical protein R2695_00600 [Acidimicrobiales bacterium]